MSEEASSIGDISDLDDLADTYFEDSSHEKDSTPSSALVGFSFDDVSSNVADKPELLRDGGLDLEEQAEPTAADRSTLNVTGTNVCQAPGLLGVEGLDEEAAAEMAEKHLMPSGLTRRDIERHLSDKKDPRKPSPLKVYSTPFNSYFSQLLQEDGKSVTDSLIYSPSTYAVSVWKGQDDDISTIGSVTNYKMPDNIRIAKSDDQSEPPMIRNAFSGKQSLHTTETDDSQDHLNTARSDGEPNFKRRKLVAVILSFVFLFLSAACIALTLSLIRLRHTNHDSIDKSNPTFSPGLQTEAPTSFQATILDRDTENPLNVSTANSPPLMSNKLDLLQKITNASPTSLQFLGDTASPQYRAFEWVASDPKYQNYPVFQIMQRWVLATFYLSTSDRRSKRLRSLSSSWNSSQGWMTYSNECSWYFGNADSVCNSEGRIVSIEMSKNNLVGTLPAELSLLSETLGKFFGQLQPDTEYMQTKSHTIFLTTDQSAYHWSTILLEGLSLLVLVC